MPLVKVVIMALNKLIIYNKKIKTFVITVLKKTCLIKQFYRHCSGTAIFLKKVDFNLSVSRNNENKLKLTFQFPLAKGNFI